MSRHQHQIVDTLTFFLCDCEKFLLITGKSGSWLHSSNIIPNVWAGHRKKFKRKKNLVIVDGFSSSIKSWSKLCFMLKICFFEILHLSLFIWALSSQWKVFFFTLEGTHYRPLDWFYYFRKLVFVACYFLSSICHVIETRKHCQWTLKSTYRLDLF